MPEAKKIVKNPDLIDKVQGKYCLLWILAPELNFETFEKAINLMDGQGWRPLYATSSWIKPAVFLCSLMEKISE